MSSNVAITVEKMKQVEAARELSTVLNNLGIRHAIFGGFAVALYGSLRLTKDVDILIDIPAKEINDFLLPRVTEINPHFAKKGLKYYFVPQLIEGLEGEQLVLANKDNILIETLPTNSLGLPTTITPSMILHGEEREEGAGLPTVHPSVLVLMKIKRWAAISTSTYPPAAHKALTDLADIKFLVDWLADRNLKISVPAYNAAVPERLYEALKKYEDFLKESNEAEKLAKLMAVL